MNPGPNQQSTTNTQPVVGSFDNSGNVIQLYGPNSVPLTLNGMTGVVDGSNASAGQIGEYQSSTVLVASAVSLTTGTPANVTSIALTAGDWDVSGIVSYHSASGTTVPNDVLQGISTTSATVGAQGSFSYDYIAVAITDDPSYVAPVVRVNISATTNVYLVTKADFSVSTLTAYGFMSARRVR